MDEPFPRSRQALDADGYGGWLIGWAAVGLLAAAWVAWFVVARVGVYAVSESARLEVSEALQPLESPVSGKIVAIAAALGDRVEAGAALFQIEAEVQRLQLERQRRQGASSAAQRAAIDEELRVKARALDQQLDASRVALAEARARQSETDEQARFAAVKGKRMEDLFARGLISEVERLEAQTQMRQSLASGETQRLAVVRLESELLADENAGRAELAELERERARLAGDIDTSETSVERLEHELGQRVVRAPVTGKIATLAELRAGAVVAEGERLGAIVPDGDVEVVAEFDPSAALGRVQPGQLGRLRLEGFSWTHYGSLVGRVKRVAAEPRSGRVVVEMELTGGEDSGIPLQHGLPGSLEIQVERVSPVTLVLRAAGRRLTGAGSSGGGSSSTR